MRMRCVSALAAIVLLVSFNVIVAARTASDQAALSKMELPKRLLRSYKPESPSEDDAMEERTAVSSGLTKLGELAHKSSATNLANKLLLKAKNKPDSVFKLLGLAEAGVKLDDNPAFFKWLNFTKAYMKKRSNAYSEWSMYNQLRQTASDGDLAVVIQKLKGMPEWDELASNVQRMQFDDWAMRKLSPEVIAQEAFKIDDLYKVSGTDPRREVLVQYSVSYTEAMRNEQIMRDVRNAISKKD